MTDAATTAANGGDAPDSGRERFGHAVGTYAAEHLSPAFPQRAPWGTSKNLRAWQAEAISKYFETEPKDFLASATPGAGKTTFALRLAAELLSRRTVNRIIVVAPTDHLKTQWAEAADRVGIRLDPKFSNNDGAPSREYHGVAVTYAQIASKPSVHDHLTASSRTLVILDEVHHGGDTLSWGDGIREAFRFAERRLSLTGTPFRSDTAPIPYVTYQPDEEGIRTSVTDFSYGYGRALADGVVRPVLFMSYAGNVRWRDTSGEEMAAGLAEDNTKDITSQAWRTALDPEGQWMPQVLRAADRRLDEVRAEVPDAGGLVIATDHAAAKGYAALLESITGTRPALILSDDRGASDRISSFAASDERWMVAVRMVSEGVDVPRLAVGVYATNASTPLFFAQAIGRFVRARRKGEVATVFVPSVPQLTNLAHALELERDHALDRRTDGGDENENLDDALLEEAEAGDRASDELERFTFEPIASEAVFDKVLYDGGDFGYAAEVGSEEELEYLGLPGILEVEQVRSLLSQRQAKQGRIQEARAQKGIEPPPTTKPLFRNLKEQRQLLNSLVGAYSKLSGQPHGVIHAELRRSCGGPAVGQATVTQIQSRIELLRKRMHS
ncbi:DEAD/DEAH box helicase [Pseudoclavibacter chungangensis]|uniref:DEAD/DEAH box helicase n=1 Tax=Pseudoclavibacter chungangensis TaxID=587635 RepID=A0A7J5C0E7_9MICO|nr:DEAD/DEAH box helicase [Pseudoclavibacter chungangensis]KAB1660194.1 DEAD/DEAH box helicase [Pseudoclavibacter chungangensis]NYJ66687.1 superfamily II DNA or RNA helicase [Pseudoclavibacter chungangensis]